MPGKVPFFSRQMLFIYPNWIVVFDRVESGDPSFAKQFHLHAPDELTVNSTDAEAVVTTTNVKDTTIATPGRLFVKSLLPAKAAVEKVEGLAVYGGKSHLGKDPYNGQILCPTHLQITAPQEKTSFFLTAMYACDATVEKAPEAQVTEETPDKVTISLDGGKHEVTFSKTGEVGWKMVK
jgi:hypothetical protein